MAKRSIPSGFCSSGFEKAVQAFQDTVRDPGFRVVQDSLAMLFNSFGKADNGFQAAVAGPPIPFVQKIGCPVTVIGENVLESQLDSPCPGYLEIA
jgi:hypothetical protein